MTALTDDARRALAAAYADIDAEGGDHPEESAEFNQGFRVGLELALVKIDQMLNADEEPNEAWIAEGLSRLRAADPAITYEDACRLGVLFGRAADWRNDQDLRINEWLKGLIERSKANPLFIQTGEDTREYLALIAKALRADPARSPGDRDEIPGTRDESLNP